MGVMAMNEKERLRKAIFEMVNQKRITLAQACVQLQDPLVLIDKVSQILKKI
jgi:hypothetical protein